MSNYLFSFDPGIRTAGVAMFRDSVLVHAGLARSEEHHARGPAAWKKMGEAVESLVLGWTQGTTFCESDSTEFVCELMQVYGGPAGGKADPADLLELMGVNGVVAAQFDGAACGYTPRQWKKSVPKNIHSQRILARLTPGELTSLDDPSIIPSLKHNAVDAVGIGLFHLLRLRPGKKWGVSALPEELETDDE